MEARDKEKGLLVKLFIVEGLNICIIHITIGDREKKAIQKESSNTVNVPSRQKQAGHVS